MGEDFGELGELIEVCSSSFESLKLTKEMNDNSNDNNSTFQFQIVWG